MQASGRAKGFVVLVTLACSAASAAAQYALSPLPSLSPTACQGALAQVAQFQPLPAIAGAGECVAADVVLLKGITLPDRTELAIAPPATLRCTMAEQVARWVREDVFPSVQVMAGTKLGTLDELASYDCRTQNHIRGAPTSEHGLANALDVRDFKLANGKVLNLTDVTVAKSWREVLRASACARFMTVLGPGSDGYHEEHIHLDLAEHRGDYRICEWDVRDRVTPAQVTEPQSVPKAATIAEPVPLPRPRPLALAADDGRAKPKKVNRQFR
jgi:hypothetical protein